MTENYGTELVQVAASALAALQVAEIDSTRLDGTREGVRGQIRLESLLERVRKEREAQELKWGSRTSREASPFFWLLVITEEIGEVAEEINVDTPGEAQELLHAIRAVGRTAKRQLEAG